MWQKFPTCCSQMFSLIAHKITDEIITDGQRTISSVICESIGCTSFTAQRWTGGISCRPSLKPICLLFWCFHFIVYYTRSCCTNIDIALFVHYVSPSSQTICIKLQYQNSIFFTLHYITNTNNVNAYKVHSM